MKTVIRHKAFETNSSSTHSICVYEGSESRIEAGFQRHTNGEYEVEFGQFGWDHDTFYSFSSKVDYLYMYLNYTENDKLDRFEYIKNGKVFLTWLTSEFEKRNLTISFKCYDESEGRYDKTFYSTGYIDHQSYPMTSMENEVLTSQKAILNFLFNEDCYIETDNDNH